MKRLAAILVLVFIAFAMSGCFGSKSSVSGTYENDENSNEYFEFSGGGSVKYHKDGQSISGVYAESEGFAVAVQLNDGTSMGFVLTDNGKTLVGTNTYVKRGFWEKHWWKILIGFIILAVISTIFKSVTGKDIDEAIEDWEDKMDEKLDKRYEEREKKR